MDKKTIHLALFLSVVGGVCAFLIAYVNSLTMPIIEQRLERETKQNIERFFPLVETYDEKTIADNMYETLMVEYTVKAGDEIIGYIYQSKVKGYGGDIQALISFDATNQTLMDIAYIGSFSETPGFGTRVKEPEFLSQIQNQDVNNLSVDTLSGATITSKAVKQMIDEANAYYLHETGGAQS